MPSEATSLPPGSEIDWRPPPPVRSAYPGPVSTTTGRPAEAVARLSVATYNLSLGADLAPLFGVADLSQLIMEADRIWAAVSADLPARTAAAARVLARAAPDVIGLQEVCRWQVAGAGPVAGYDVLGLLLAELAALGRRYTVAGTSSSFSSSGLPAPIPLPGGDVVQLAAGEATLIRADARATVATTVAARWGAGFADLLSVDILGAAVPVARAWHAVDVDLPGLAARIVTTHLEAYDAGVRTAQARQLLTDLAALPGAGERPLVVLADLNCPPDPAAGDAYTVLAEAGLTAAATGPTCCQDPDLANPTGALNQQIDLVLVEPDRLRIRAANVSGHRPDDRTPSGRWPSDHAMVTVTVEPVSGCR